MIRSENLRSGYIQDDVEEYLYQLLPERDAVVAEIEDYAAQNDVPIIGPAVARMLTLFVQVSGAKRIFDGHRVFHDLAGARGRTKSKGDLYGWRSGESAPREGLFSPRGRRQTD